MSRGELRSLGRWARHNTQIIENFEYQAKEFRIFIWYWVVIEDF